MSTASQDGRSGPGALRRTIDAWDRHQIIIYLVGLAAGALVGLATPGAATGFEHAVEPVLATLLYATFLQVPFTAVAHAFRDLRFLGTVLVLNFAILPLVVWALTFLLPGGTAVLVGVLLVLLAPCIDYVIVFAGLAGGSERRLLAAAPLLMLVQLALLPVYLLIFVGSDIADVVEPGPFVRAFVVLIAIPLTLALLTELLARRHRLGTQITAVMTDLMVPLLFGTLLVVVASQINAVGDSLGIVARLIPVYVVFAVVMTGVGWATARAARLDPAGGRALVFSGVTRNSLVVLPLALALPAPYALAPTVVVTQTLVELIAMLVLVRVVPRLLPPPG